MLVDDSAVIRGLIARALEADPAIEITATAANGETAITMLRARPVDVIVLDIEMPVIDGITALPELLKISPQTRIIMASTLTTRNAEISLKALALGAVDFMQKPSATLTAMGIAPEIARGAAEGANAPVLLLDLDPTRDSHARAYAGLLAPPQDDEAVSRLFRVRDRDGRRVQGRRYQRDRSRLHAGRQGAELLRRFRHECDAAFAVVSLTCHCNGKRHDSLLWSVCRYCYAWVCRRIAEVAHPR